MLIEGERVYLDQLSAADAPVVSQWLNEYELRKLFFSECPLPLSQEATAAWIRGFHANPQSFLLAVRLKEEQRLIGMFTLRKISWVSRSLRFGSALWPSVFWNQGIGSEARRAFLLYAFQQLGFRRVYGAFGDYNIASRKSHEKLGADISAQNRDAAYFDGCYHDLIHYSYAREKFPGVAASQNPGRSRTVAKTDPAMVMSDIDRLYQDFYGLPDPNQRTRRHWVAKNAVGKDKWGQVVLLPEFIRRSGSLLFFPTAGRKPSPGLIQLAIGLGFERFNLHRLEICLPQTAVRWHELLISQGFSLEGKLDQVCYAGGRYFDLLFFSILGKE